MNEATFVFFKRFSNPGVLFLLQRRASRPPRSRRVAHVQDEQLQGAAASKARQHTSCSSLRKDLVDLDQEQRRFHQGVGIHFFQPRGRHCSLRNESNHVEQKTKIAFYKAYLFRVQPWIKYPQNQTYGIWIVIQ